MFSIYEGFNSPKNSNSLDNSFRTVLTTAEARTIRMVYIEAPPFYYTDEKGSPQGFLIDLMRQVVQKAGYELETFSFPTKRMAYMLINGKADVWLGVSEINDFKCNTLIGKIDIINVVLNIYFIGNKKPLLNKGDFHGKSVIILRGYSYGGSGRIFRAPVNQVNYVESGSHTSAFKMLRAGRADYSLDYKTPANRTLKTVKISELKSARISSVPLKFVVSKKTPDAANILIKLRTPIIHLWI